MKYAFCNCLTGLGVFGYKIMVVIIKAGFQEVNTSVFRPKSSSESKIIRKFSYK